VVVERVFYKVTLEILLRVLLLGAAKSDVVYTDCTHGNGHCVALSKNAQLPSLSYDRLIQASRWETP
jgi:hypothetical protein